MYYYCEEASLILTPAAGPKRSPPALAGPEGSVGPDSGNDREIPQGPRSQGIWSSAGAWMRSECAGGEQREGAELGGGGACPLGVLSSSAPFLGVCLEPALFLAPGRWTCLQSRTLINKLQWMSWCAHLFPFGSKHKAWAPSYIPPHLPSQPTL